MKRCSLLVGLGGLIGMFLIPPITPAAIWAPHTLESRLDEASAVVQGIILPGEEREATFRTVPCERPPMPPNSPIASASPNCPMTFYRVQVLEDLRGTIKPGTQIAIVNTREGVFLDPKDNNRYRAKSSASADFAVGEKVLVILKQPKIILPTALSALQKEMGELYEVVGNATGKWTVEPDGLIHWGSYLPEPQRYRIPITREEFAGLVPIPERTMKEIETASPAWRQRKAEQEARSPYPSVAESLATSQPIWNPSKMTLQQMRQAVARHQLESPDQKKDRNQQELELLRQWGWRP